MGVHVGVELGVATGSTCLGVIVKRIGKSNKLSHVRRYILRRAGTRVIFEKCCVVSNARCAKYDNANI